MPTVDQPDAGSMGIFPRRTNQSIRALVKRHRVTIVAHALHATAWRDDAYRRSTNTSDLMYLPMFHAPYSSEHRCISCRRRGKASTLVHINPTNILIEGLRLVGVCGIFSSRGCDWSA
eukprot:7016650-Pyramimonas_sp.AAC.1